MGLPVLPAFSLCTCCRHYPGAASECMSLLTSPDVSAFPDRVVGSACAMSFSRLARRSLTLRPAHSPSHQVTFYIEGFSHFVTSMTASIASGWSKSCLVGLSPTGKRRLSTAHTPCRRFPNGNIIMESGQSTLVKQTGTSFQLQIIILFCPMFFKLLLNINGFHVIINYNTSSSFFGKAIMSIKDRI
jgi:hypothetical protein